MENKRGCKRYINTLKIMNFRNLKIILFPLLFIPLFLSCNSTKSYTGLISENYMIAGVIRRVSPEPWYAINDNGHLPLGISSITEDLEKITVNYNFTATKVNTFSATVDETFASEGYSCGASVGLTHADIYMYQNVDGTIKPVDPTAISSSEGNIWIFGVFL
jgi:hypothetical protein